MIKAIKLLFFILLLLWVASIYAVTPINNVVLGYTDQAPISTGDPKYRNRCEFGETDHNDFLVYPGIADGSMHWHQHFGAIGTNHNTINAGLKSLPTTCWGGFIKSAMWFPAVVDNATGLPVTNGHVTVYYSRGSGNAAWGAAVEQPNQTALELMPPDFTLIAGKALDAAYNAWMVKNNKLTFACMSLTGGGEYNKGGVLPICGANSEIQIRITFPSCFNASNSPGNMAHVAYPRTGDWQSFGNVNECPSTHPHRTYTIAYLIHYDHPTANLSANWSVDQNVFFHADYSRSVNEFLFDEPVRDCIIAGKDCKVGIVGSSGLKTLHPDFSPTTTVE